MLNLSKNTFFIRGLGGLDGIWVHNKNCFDNIPPNTPEPRLIADKKVYTFTHPLTGRKTQVIENPDPVAREAGQRYVEVIAKPNLNTVTIKQENRPTTTYDFENNSIEVERGSTRRWNSNLNNPLPSQRYELDNGHVFNTDEYGRVNQVEANLNLNSNARNEGQQRTAGGTDRQTDDHGGHLIASMFDGAGEGINLVPMNAKFNGSSGKWYQLEQRWKTALENDGTVQVTINPIYEGSSKRPSEFEVIQRINNGLEEVINLKNTPTGD